MKLRKLLPKRVLQSLYTKAEIGVPIAKLTRDSGFKVSPVTMKNWLDIYSSMLDDKTTNPVVHKVIHDSLFPSWLEDIPAVQEQPPNWKYIGRFPVGAWHEDK